MHALEDIHKQIEELRKQMIAIAEEHGRIHPSCIEVSKELDMLLNQYEKEKARVHFQTK